MGPNVLGYFQVAPSGLEGVMVPFGVTLRVLSPFFIESSQSQQPGEGEREARQRRAVREPGFRSAAPPGPIWIGRVPG